MKNAEVNGVQITFTDIGEGAPVLCLHGGMGLDGFALRAPGVLDIAADGHRVVIPDQRGHGASSQSDAAMYTRYQWASDAHALAGALALTPCALLGHSYGGFIALEYALRWPESLTHLVLVATSAGPVRSESQRIATERDLRRLVRGSWPRLFVGDDKHWELFSSAQFSLDAYNAAFMRDLPSYDVRARIGEVNTPTLLIVGRHDPYVADMEWLAANMRNARLHILENTGHFPFVEAPKEFAGIVTEFLAR